MTGDAVTGVPGCMPWQNSYQNNVLFGDMFGMGSGTGFGMDMGMGMDSSIFGGMGQMPFMGGMNYDAWYQNMDKNQEFMYNQQIRQAERARNADARANSPMEDIQIQADTLHEKVMQGEQEQILPALRTFLNSVKSAYGNGTMTDAEALARAKTLYKGVYKTTLTDDIRKNGNGSFEQGLYQTLSFGLADKRTAEDNISTLNGQPVSRWENGKKIAGNAAGGAVMGGVAMFALSFCKYIPKMFKSKPAVAALVGGIIGGLSSMGLGALVGKGSSEI